MDDDKLYPATSLKLSPIEPPKLAPLAPTSFAPLSLAPLGPPSLAPLGPPSLAPIGQPSLAPLGSPSLGFSMSMPLPDFVDVNYDHNPAIPPLVIGEYEFYLVYRIYLPRYRGTTKMPGYKYVAIDSVKITDRGSVYRFVTYASGSELGIWRICSQMPMETRVFNDKFVYPDTIPNYTGDYAQSSLVHINLQKHINEHYDAITEVKADRLKDNEQPEGFTRYKHFSTTYKTSNISCKELIPTYDPAVFPPELINSTRELKVYPFNLLEKTLECGVKATTQKFKEFSALVSTVKDYYVLDPTSIQKVCNWTNTLDNSLTATGEIKMCIMNRTERPIPSEPTITTTAEPPQVCLIFYEFKLTECPGTNLSPHRTNIRTLCSTSETRYSPIALTTPENLNETNKFGAFVNYITAGYYICKPFDYDFQCPENVGVPCTLVYNYIGDIYNSWYPFNELRRLSSPPKAPTLSPSMPPPPPIPVKQKIPIEPKIAMKVPYKPNIYMTMEPDKPHSDSDYDSEHEDEDTDISELEERLRKLDQFEGGKGRRRRRTCRKKNIKKRKTSKRKRSRTNRTNMKNKKHTRRHTRRQKNRS